MTVVSRTAVTFSLCLVGEQPPPKRNEQPNSAGDEDDSITVRPGISARGPAENAPETFAQLLQKLYKVFKVGK
ncbi:hypothetical protein FBQ99_01740 [Chloroflexi bacterium CFX2]|nr:hypothetical protein [Chloroflexi bacterium CFX2]